SLQHADEPVMRYSLAPVHEAPRLPSTLLPNPWYSWPAELFQAEEQAHRDSAPAAYSWQSEDRQPGPADQTPCKSAATAHHSRLPARASCRQFQRVDRVRFVNEHFP